MLDNMFSTNTGLLTESNEAICYEEFLQGLFPGYHQPFRCFQCPVADPHKVYTRH